MTVVFAKDGFIVTDSAVSQFGDKYNAFLAKKSFQTSDRNYYVTGAGSLIDLQKAQDYAENMSNEPVETVTSGISSILVGETDIYLSCLKNNSILYFITKEGVEKIPSEVNMTSGICPEYQQALLDTGMSAVQAASFILDNQKFSTVSYPLWVYNTLSGEEVRVDEEGNFHGLED